MFSVRVLAFITAFLLPVFFSGDRLEKTVIAESGVPLSLVFKNECTVPLELYLTAEESQGDKASACAKWAKCDAFLGGQCCTRVCRDLYRYAYRRREHDIYRAVRGRRKRKASHSWREAKERNREMDCPCIAPLWLGRARRRRLGAAHTPHSKPQERAIIKTLQEMLRFDKAV